MPTNSPESPFTFPDLFICVSKTQVCVDASDHPFIRANGCQQLALHPRAVWRWLVRLSPLLDGRLSDAGTTCILNVLFL